MTIQKFPSHDELRSLFKAAAEQENTSSNADGTGTAVEILSRAISDLRAIGISVELDLSMTYFEESFELAHKINNQKVPRSIALSGVLTIEGQDRLVAIMVTENSQPALSLYVSNSNFASRHITVDHRGHFFDLKNDDQAVTKFQGFVLEKAASTLFIREHDITQSLGCSKQSAARLDKKKI